MTDKPPIKTHTVHHADIAYTVVCRVFSHHADFDIYEIEEHDMTGREGDTTTIWWPRAKPHIDPRKSHIHTTKDIAEARRFAHGFVKWDGCSDWFFDHNMESCSVHGCSRSDLIALGELLARCFDMAAEHLPNWHDAGRYDHG